MVSGPARGPGSEERTREPAAVAGMCIAAVGAALVLVAVYGLLAQVRWPWMVGP